MKKLNNAFFRIALIVYGFWMSVQPVLAQSNFESLKTVTERASTGVKDMIRPIAGLISWVMLFVSLPMLLWAFIRRGKQDGQSNDALIAWGTGLLIGWGLIQLVLLIVGDTVS